MQDRPADLDELALRHALTGWGVDAAELAYVPVGFGDHHWSVADTTGRRWFVTVADLANKAHCGTTPPAALRGLRAAMDTAAALEDPAGHDFVVAPVRDANGETVRPLGTRYAVSVFPFADGTAGDFGDVLPPADRERVIDLLADLHRRTPPTATPLHEPRLPTRDELERALAQPDRPWRGGPFAEPTRRLLAENAAGLHRSLKEFDALIAEVHGRRPRLVVTHGEPHPGNLLRAGERFRLLDWDTVGLAPPERDLWLAATGPADLDRYADASGHRPDPAALALYRLRWALDDLATFVEWFRAPHERTPDTEVAWSGCTETVRRLVAGATTGMGPLHNG
ncbi:phosphotransferase [Marinactinospora rubrisoli]|uniref:Phosphotransferase n=1 Tax=Marinactinospora rubrisoli TaxID=2715399 RepID=A0ABW2KEP9_9ACTN